jgi:RNA polymerase sigma-70 factor (ECF subfamily)
MPKEGTDMSASTPSDPLRTRASLLSRVRDMDNAESWGEFFRRYQGLIRRLALRAGLSEAEADDVLQETMVCLTKQLPDFRYDPAKGSFKGWLARIVQRRVVDQFRKRAQQASLDSSSLDQLAAETATRHDAAWEEEWERHLLNEASARARAASSPLQFQMFDLYALQGVKLAEVKRLLKVNAPQVYMAKLRVGAIFRREVKALRAELE